MNKNRGITLITLVITIIILMILAGITINLTLGETGIFTRAKQAKENYLLAVNIEEESLRNAELALQGSTTNGDETEDNEKDPPVTTKLKIGDYVDYDPTKADANKTVDVDANLLTYTSQVGGFDTNGNEISGNGCTEQKFIALPSESLMWRILDIEEENILLIPNRSVYPHLYNGFYMEFGFGYIFAENEIHKICSIYGHGYGTNLENSYEYYIGGPFDVPKKMKTKNTAARSITLKDLYKLVNMESSSNYNWDGITTKTGNYPTEAIYYPSLDDTDKTVTGAGAGRSNSKVMPIALNSPFDSDEDRKELFKKVKETIPFANLPGSFYIANRICKPEDGVVSYRCTILKSISNRIREC